MIFGEDIRSHSRNNRIFFANVAKSTKQLNWAFG